MVKEEFGKSRSYASRQLSAAAMETRNELPVGTLTEGTLRRIRAILPDEDRQDEVLGVLAINDILESPHEILAQAKRIYVRDNGHANTTSAMMGGRLGINDAYELTQLLSSAPDDMKDLIALCSDPSLAKMMLALPDSNTRQEIVATRSIPTVRGAQIPLPLANGRDLAYYLERASYEYRQAAVTARREARDEAIEGLIKLCQDIAGIYCELQIKEMPRIKELLCVIHNHSRQNSANGAVSPT